MRVSGIKRHVVCSLKALNALFFPLARLLKALGSGRGVYETCAPRQLSLARSRLFQLSQGVYLLLRVFFSLSRGFVEAFSQLPLLAIASTHQGWECFLSIAVSILRHL